MEDLVAARVHDHAGEWYGFMTWGRIVDCVDDSWLKEIVRVDASLCGIEGITEIRVCDSLSEVASCRYFYEGLFHFANAGIPFGASYDAWKQHRLDEITHGTPHVYFLGQEREAESEPKP